MSDSAPQPTPGPTPPTPATPPDSRRRIGVLGRVLVGLSGAAWVLALATAVVMVIAFLTGELAGMVALSGIVIVAFAVAGAVLISGVTALYLYLTRPR
ncbi:hypothetical protein [Catellatospora sp. NPDC049609]|uniref:hypothetical protein n=1 Tax=Catellatospora sp. NPDC049609 TaxID=3155505 RepID=UPI00341E599B